MQFLANGCSGSHQTSEKLGLKPGNFSYLLAMALGFLACTTIKADANFDTWHVGGDWYSAENARLDTWNEKRLIGDRGEGVLINGRIGKTRSLITKRRDYRDVELHVEFMVAKGANSGIIFHGNYEIQILDSAHVKEPTGAHCGGIYPRAEEEPTYHHIDKGSPPRVNAAKKPGEWQTMDIIFQSPRFDKNGKKTSNARFVKVVQNGQVIQENVEVPYACGPNWNRRQHPKGPIIIQGDYGPIAIRNVRVRDWNGTSASVTGKLNVPPPGFTALFNGRDFSGFRMSPRAKEMWTIEDGILKAPKLLEQWGADLVTESTYKDFVLLADFRMPKGSDSGIHFRKFVPDMGYFSQNEQINLGTGQRMGQVESFGYMRHKKMPVAKRLKPNEFPKVKNVDPEPDQWHTIKITMQDRALSIEVDGETTLGKFAYPAWLLGDEPAPIRFQKHRFTEMGDGKRNPCPIEYRNLFIKEIRDSSPVKKAKLNEPPEGFTALFNGKNFAGWHTPPLVRQYWSIEDGILKSPGLIKTWGASLSTKKHYRDFILMLDFRMPTLSDSGINFRRLIPKIPGFGNMEQFNLRSKGGMGHLESYYFLPKETAKRMKLKEEEKPHCRHIDPEVGIWHTVKLTMQGRTFSAEYDGELIHDRFQYHDWMINMEPAPIRLQKHIVVHGDNLGATNACPIEYRNIFIKELDPPAEERPNVVLLLVDDLGWQDIGCYGGPVKTSALDALASQGVRFTDFHSGSAVCSPSRATFLTGRQHIRTGVYHVLQDSSHNAHLLRREVTIAEVLKQAGYATAHFGKWHLGLTSGKRKKPSPTEHGFDYWFGVANGAGPSQKDPVNFIRNGKRVGPLKGYSCQLVVDDAIEWLKGQRSLDKPFLLNIWFNEPHSVLAAPDEIVAKYGKLKDPAALYSGAVENTDRAIASLVAKLKEMGALENTLIIYSSDNGSYRADRNGALRGAKGSNFEGGIRSPGIFYWPRGIKGGRIEEAPSGAVDLLPTICGLAGIDKPKGVHLDGADLSPLLTGRGKFKRSQPLFWYLPTSYPAAMVRDGRYTFMAYRDYKLPQDHRAMAALLKQIEKIVGKNGGESGEGNLRSRVFNSQFKDAEANRLRWQYVQLNAFRESWIPLIKKGGFDRFGLYDLDADPNQKEDISAEKPDVAARLKRQLLTINASVMADAPDWLARGELASEKARFAAPAAPLEDSPNADLLARIERNDLPEGYVPAKHQEYVDRRMTGLSQAQRARIGRLWKEKQRIDPGMPNRGKSFVRIMEYVTENPE